MRSDLSRSGDERRVGIGLVALDGLQRSHGRAEIAFKRRGAETVLGDLYQSGCSKVRLPRVHEGGLAEAVLINTAGGLTDGDRIETEVRWSAGSRAVVTSQAAERIYRARGGRAELRTRLKAAPDALALWLPQETIFFDGGGLTRRTEAHLDEGARLLACESLVLGRTAMGEVVRTGGLLDGWRVRLGGALVFADAFALDGDIEAALARPAIADGRRALATVIVAAHDAETLLPAARAAAAEASGRCAATVNGPVLVARLLAESGAGLRHDLARLLESLMAGLIGDRARLPRVWHC